jgi:hypothetical protein
MASSALVGPAAAFVYAAAGHFAPASNFWSVLAVGVIASAAALISGALVGFLFGLPKTLGRTGSKALLATNTNLDEVSDWITKILVGLGLVQLGKVASGIGGLASALDSGLGAGPGAHPFASGLLVYSAVDGFLLGYLWTRIVVSLRLNEAAQALEVRSEVLKEPLAAPPPPAPPPPPEVLANVAPEPAAPIPGQPTGDGAGARTAT